MAGVTASEPALGHQAWPEATCVWQAVCWLVSGDHHAGQKTRRLTPARQADLAEPRSSFKPGVGAPVPEEEAFPLKAPAFGSRRPKIECSGGETAPRHDVRGG